MGIRSKLIGFCQRTQEGFSVSAENSELNFRGGLLALWGLGFGYLILPYLTIQILRFGIGSENFSVWVDNCYFQLWLPQLCAGSIVLAGVYYVSPRGGLLQKIQLRMSGAPSLLTLAGWTLVIAFFAPLIKLLWLNFMILFKMPPDIQAVNQILTKMDSFWDNIGCFIGILILAPIVEEIIFRRFIFGLLLTKFSFWSSVVGSSLIFGLIHYSLSSLLGLIFIGFILQIVYCRYKSLMASIIVHVLNNFVGMVIFFIDFKLNNP